MNQVMVSNLLEQLGNHTNTEIEENLVRHMVLNSIRFNRKKFHSEYGELVICCDHTNVWRKDHFPYYKANRQKARSDSEIDWNAVFICLNKIREEIKEYFPYKVIHVERAEADDCIAVLAKRFSHTEEKILILSGDKDYSQLHNLPNVKQYDPTRKKFIECEDSNRFLFEHIMKGDSGDGIPNVLTEGDYFISRSKGDRQKSITKKMIENYINNVDGMEEDLKNKYLRNKKVIDLNEIPEYLVDQINDQYDNQRDKSRAELYNYFVKFQLKNLISDIQDF